MSVQIWHTNGVADMKAMEDNRVGLKFVSEDGTKRVLTIPATHLGALAIKLLDMAGSVSKTHDVGDTLTNLPSLSSNSVGVGAARDGSSFSLVLHIGEQTELRVDLAAETTEALAAGLIEALRQHGRAPQDLKGGDTRH